MYKINTPLKKSNLILSVKGKDATLFLVTLFLLLAQLITINSATASMVAYEQDHAPFEYDRLSIHTLSDGEEIDSSYGTLFTGGTSTKDIWEDGMIDIHGTDFAHKPRIFSRDDGDKKGILYDADDNYEHRYDDDHEYRFYDNDSHEHRFGDSDYFAGVTDDFSSPVPLPSSLALFITSLFGFIGVWRSRFFITRSPERI